MKYLRGFLLSFAFAGLVLLAFNPHFVVKLQDTVNSAEGTPYIAPDITPREPVKLPDTPSPDAANLPRIENFERIARNDPWIGAAPCGEEIFNAPLSLPGLGPRKDGPLLIKPITADDGKTIINQPTYLYRSASGVTLKLVQPVVTYYNVSGRRYRDARKYIFDKRPLESMQSAKDRVSPETDSVNPRAVTLAGILSPSSLSYTISGSRDRYKLMVKQTELTSAFLVTLPRWKNYETATASDQGKWDDLLCNAAHHELGHLRIRLVIQAETLDGYADLPPAQSREEMKNLTVDYRKDISERVQDRQEAYHVYNGGGTRRGMTELPYAELPFPWLEGEEASLLENPQN